MERFQFAEARCANLLVVSSGWQLVVLRTTILVVFSKDFGSVAKFVQQGKSTIGSPVTIRCLDVNEVDVNCDLINTFVSRGSILDEKRGHF